jgi:hypothetical protein
MSNKELRQIAEKLVAMKRFSLVIGCQTGKSQGALIQNLTPEETAELAQITLEMLKHEQLTK